MGHCRLTHSWVALTVETASAQSVRRVVAVAGLAGFQGRVYRAG
jgi:hypothetical protein